MSLPGCPRSLHWLCSAGSRTSGLFPPHRLGTAPTVGGVPYLSEALFLSVSRRHREVSDRSTAGRNFAPQSQRGRELRACDPGKPPVRCSKARLRALRAQTSTTAPSTFDVCPATACLTATAARALSDGYPCERPSGSPRK